jgi:hypothetical protein
VATTRKCRRPVSTPSASALIRLSPLRNYYSLIWLHRAADEWMHGQKRVAHYTDRLARMKNGD